MQINSTQSQPITAYQATVRNDAQTSSSNATDGDVAAVAAQNEASQVSPENVGNVKAMVAKMMAQPDIRPEVVAGRSARDPVKEPTDDQLQALIRGLGQGE